MADLSGVPKPKIEWKISIGSLVNAVLIVAGVIWTVSSFATKSASEEANDKAVALALKARIEVLDAKTSAQDSRLVAVETGIFYMRESLVRIERAVGSGR